MKKFNILQVFLLMFISVNLLAQQYWIRQPSPTNNDLSRCSFADSLYGWAVGDSGIIINTINGGANWNIQLNGSIPNNIVMDVHFINRQYGWALRNDQVNIRSTILKTSNGGINWLSALFPDTNSYLYAIHFLDSLKGFAGCGTGEIFRTTNGGINWAKCFIDTVGCFSGYPKRDLCFINSLTGFASGGIFDVQGLIWKTTDGGIIWSTYCLPSEPIFRIKHLSGNRIAGVGGDYKFGANVFFTSNLGSSWTFEYANVFGLPTGFSFRTPAEAWVCLSFSGYWGVNTDSMKPGSRWTAVPTPDTIAIYDVEFLSPTLGWAFGAQGGIYKYNPNIIGINGNSNLTPSEFKLFQNYPNPFNPVSKIKYQISKSSDVKIVIYDLLGNEVTVLINANQNAGSYEAIFDGTNFASGVYYYKLTAGEYSETKKMVLMK